MAMLNGLNKDDAVKATQKVPFRLLEDVSELSHGNSVTENVLIHGDNFEALKSGKPA